MRWLIDGYNVMHAGGRVARGTTPEHFQRARRRFLDELADVLGSETAGVTTVVFDANSRPNDFPLESTYQGLRVIFALNDENADARIEAIIAKQPTPKTLTVVSTDHRIRRAAKRRRCPVMTADAYWGMIDNQKERNRNAKRKHAMTDRLAPPPKDDSQFWENEFADLDASPEIQQLGQPVGRRLPAKPPETSRPANADSIPPPNQSRPSRSQQEKAPAKSKKASLPTVDEERRFWQAAFADIDKSEEIRQLDSRDESLLTDAEISQLEREIAREPLGQNPKYIRKKGRS